jgi:hypothetical protein
MTKFFLAAATPNGVIHSLVDLRSRSFDLPQFSLPPGESLL